MHLKGKCIQYHISNKKMVYEQYLKDFLSYKVSEQQKQHGTHYA